MKKSISSLTEKYFQMFSLAIAKHPLQLKLQPAKFIQAFLVGFIQKVIKGTFLCILKPHKLLILIHSLILFDKRIIECIDERLGCAIEKLGQFNFKILLCLTAVKLSQFL